MKILTSMTFFNDAVGKRMSVSYSEVDENTGRIISDNNRKDRLILDSTLIAKIGDLEEFAAEFINEGE